VSPRAAAYVAFLVVAGIVGFFSIYSKFAAYDDEGYVLLSIKQFVAGGSLYNDVYSQYGPFHYELWGGLYALTGRTVTPDTGRAIVIAVWLAIALLTGLTVERLTQRLSLGVSGAIVAFATATAITNEPMHPGGLADLLLIGIVAAAVLLERRARLRMGLIGFLLAALVLTKINIGATALAAVCLALSVSVPTLRRRPWLTPALTAGCIVLPFLLTARDLQTGWAQNLAVLVSLSIAAVGITLIGLRQWRPSNHRSGEGLGVIVAAFATGIAAIVVAIVATGTSVSDLVNGVLIRPLGQRDAFSIPASSSTLALDFGFLGLLAAVGVRRVVVPQRPSLVAGTARVVAALIIWLLASATLPISITPDPGPLGLALPLTWLAALPPRGRSANAGPGAFARALLPALAVLGALVIYPVAGSQVGFAAVLFIPAGGLILADGLRQVGEWYEARGPERGAQFATAVPLAAITLVAALTYQVLLQPAVLNTYAYRHLKHLPFGGATHVRQPATTADGFARIVSDLRARCDTFVTLPGMNSFYLWSRMTPPTNLNTTSWMYLLDAAEQQRIVNAITPVRRLCLIRSDQELAMWVAPDRPLPERPLLRFEENGFTVIDDVNGYKLMVRG